jgi:hypothetical protein
MKKPSSIASRAGFVFLAVLILLGGAEYLVAGNRAERREKRGKARPDNPAYDEIRHREVRNMIPQQFLGWTVRNARAANLATGEALRVFTEGRLIAILVNNSLERLQPPLRVSLRLRTPNDLPLIFSWIEPSRLDDVFRWDDEAIIRLRGDENWQTVETVLTPIEPVRSLRMVMPTSAPTGVDIDTLVLNDSVGRTARFDFGKEPARPAWTNGGYRELIRE